MIYHHTGKFPGLQIIDWIFFIVLSQKSFSNFFVWAVVKRDFAAMHRLFFGRSGVVLPAIAHVVRYYFQQLIPFWILIYSYQHLHFTLYYILTTIQTIYTYTLWLLTCYILYLLLLYWCSTLLCDSKPGANWTLIYYIILLYHNHNESRWIEENVWVYILLCS